MKSFITICLLALSLNALSQIQKGQWLIGGNAAFSYASSKELKLTTLQFSPAGGYFLINRLAGGLRINFDSQTYKWDDKYRFTNVAAAPFLRYYLLPVEQKVNLFADAAYGFAWGKSKNYNVLGKHSFHFNTLSLMAGPAIFLNERTALEVTFGYTHLTRGPIDSTVTNRLQLGIGLQIHLGKPKE